MPDTGAAPGRAAKVWAGRLPGATSPRVEAYTSGFDTDWRLLPDDLAGSRAHAAMLCAVGLLTPAEQSSIDSGLDAVAAEVASGTFALLPGDEDIHTAVERRLAELAGDVAGSLHSGRSRNDQVATDLRLYARRECGELARAAVALQAALLERATAHARTVMPGYTHLQRAQPVTLGHHLLAYIEMLQRDVMRLLEARVRCDVLPLGSGALAGSTLPLDRELVARLLGFSAVSANSIDAVSDRDFVVEITGACALLLVHLSRLAEELVLWSSSEFGYAELPDAHATGSSLMPQKKNPDVAELARGRTGHAIGALVAVLTTLKGLPLAYNRDLQEDKRSLFLAVDTTRDTLAVITEIISGVRFDAGAMRAAASDAALLATDVAEHLVQHGERFREAHRLVGTMVTRVRDERRTLRDVSEQEWLEACGPAGAGITKLFELDAALRRRDLPGGPGPSAAGAQLARATHLIEESRRRLTQLE